jgi:hypothetical protein
MLVNKANVGDRDVLRRHYMSCTARGFNPVPQYHKSGPKRSACDNCAESKIACNAEDPCDVPHFSFSETRQYILTFADMFVV